MEIVKKAYAKVNLALNITGRNGELHTLDMIMTNIDLADTVTLIKRTGDKFTVKYSNKDVVVGKDTVSKAIEFFSKEFIDNTTIGIDVTVQKNIPVAAGLGGSGVDAAAVLLALCEIYAIHVNNIKIYKKIEQIAKQIGSDVLYQLKGGFARVEGVGDKITHFKSCRTLYMVVAMGQNGVLSSDSYAAFDKMYAGKQKLVTDIDEVIKMLTQNGPINYNLFANALTKPSIFLNKTIIDTLESLREVGAINAVMTGSGAACIGFFETKEKAQTAADKLKKVCAFSMACSTV